MAINSIVSSMPICRLSDISGWLSDRDTVIQCEYSPYLQTIIPSNRHIKALCVINMRLCERQGNGAMPLIDELLQIVLSFMPRFNKIFVMKADLGVCNEMVRRSRIHNTGSIVADLSIVADSESVLAIDHSIAGIIAETTYKREYRNDIHYDGMISILRHIMLISADRRNCRTDHGQIVVRSFEYVLDKFNNDLPDIYQYCSKEAMQRNVIKMFMNNYLENTTQLSKILNKLKKAYNTLDYYLRGIGKS